MLSAMAPARTRVAAALRGVVIAAVLCASAACYESDTPLDAVPLIDITPTVLGTWRCLPLDGDADEPAITLTVRRSSQDRLYDALWQEPGKAPDRYEAYASVLQGTTLLNVRERDERGPTGKWTFLRYTLLRPNVLHLQVVAEAGMATVPRTAAAVRAAVERDRNTPAFYSDVAACARAKVAQ